MLNSQQTKELTTLLIHRVSNDTYRNELQQLNDYATYFLMATISQNTIKSTRKISKYMNEPSDDLNPLSCFYLTNLQLINKIFNPKY